MEKGIGRAAYTTPLSLVFGIPDRRGHHAPPSFSGIWGMLMGGTGTFKQVYAILAHSGVIFALSVLFAMPLSYATHRMAGANLGVFVPMLEETTFLARFLGAIDLFSIWWSVNVAIGVGVLFKRKTGGIAAHVRRTSTSLVGAASLAHRALGKLADRFKGAWMTTRTKIVIAVVVVLVGGAVVAANIYYRRDRGVQVATEAIRARDLEAIVSASGKIQPKRQVNISANTMGKVTRLAVEEGQRVKAGQFLLEIDPRSLEGQLAARRGQRGRRAVVAAAGADRGRAGQRQPRSGPAEPEAPAGAVEGRADHARRRSSARRTSVAVREADLQAREQEIQTREQQIKQEQAGLATTKYNLNQVIISSPMDGLVTRRNIEEGETAVVGTMNNAGTVLLTIADMSVLEAEVEVDETDIPNVTLGQVAKVTIDAVPDREFKGHVTEIGNSPIQTSTSTTGQRQATTFKVVVTIDEQGARRAPRLHVHGRDHDGHAEERRLGARSRR